VSGEVLSSTTQHCTRNRIWRCFQCVNMALTTFEATEAARCLGCFRSCCLRENLLVPVTEPICIIPANTASYADCYSLLRFEIFTPALIFWPWFVLIRWSYLTLILGPFHPDFPWVWCPHCMTGISLVDDLIRSVQNQGQAEVGEN